MTEPWLWPFLGALGVLGGALSTVTGLGGGIVVVLTLSLLWDPRTALATTAPALLLGNTHRVFLFRRKVDRRIATSFILGAFPGAFVGSVLAVTLPEVVLTWVLLGVSLLAFARALGWFNWAPPPSALAPAGFVAGGIAATSGAGILVSPVLLAAGLKGEAFIATSSATAIAIHIARILGYGVGGLMHVELLLWSAVLAAGLMLGNLVGRRVRSAIGDERASLATYAVLGIAVVLALAGVA